MNKNCPNCGRMFDNRGKLWRKICGNCKSKVLPVSDPTLFNFFPSGGGNISLDDLVPNVLNHKKSLWQRIKQWIGLIYSLKEL